MNCLLRNILPYMAPASIRSRTGLRLGFHPRFPLTREPDSAPRILLRLSFRRQTGPTAIPGLTLLVIPGLTRDLLSF